MALVKLCHIESLQEGDRIVKESWGRAVVLLRAADDQFLCVEVADAATAQLPMEQLTTAPGVRKHSTYKDSDGQLWVNLQATHKPIVDKSFRAPAPDQVHVSAEVADVPQPLAPFAGRDIKAVAPSPARPFSPTAQPLKPSPFKDRVDTATEAVVRKNWTDRQQKMGAVFGKRPPVPTAPAPAAVPAGGLDV